MEIELSEDFKELLKSLNANGVRYLLIGGYAVSYHGYARSTNDLDIFVAKDLENASCLIKSLNEFGFSGSDLSTEVFTQDKSLVIMGVEPLQVEIVNFISGVEFDEAYEDRVIGVINDVDVSIISLRFLKQNKRASGRHKDLADLEYLP